MGFRCPVGVARALSLLLILLLQGSVNGEAEHACQSVSFPFCNTTKSVEERVNDLVSRLNLQEKIEQLINTADGIPRLGIPSYQWWSEALHGVSESPGVDFSSGPIKAATSFPQTILTAASFNDSLFNQIAQVISTEARAMYNTGQISGLTFWSPNVNIFRDPRWGRGQETPGEDPTLASNYAVEFVRGMQDQSDSKTSGSMLKTSALCKHFSAYDLEKWGDEDRDHFNAIVAAQDLEDTFNPPFKSCVQGGKVSGLMCAYNRVNGVPMCGSYSFLTETVRNDWGFEGYIVSDCDAVYDMTNDPAYSETLGDAVADSLLAGLDLNCGTTYRDHANLALSQEKINVSDIDRALQNLYAVQMQLGIFDGDPKNQMYGDLGVNDVCNDEHQALALEAALQGIVLLKNDDNTLPLSRENIKSLAVVGPSATDEEYRMLGNYAGIPCKYITPVDGLAQYVSNIQYQPGCSDVFCEEEHDFTDAALAAAEADVVVILVGLSLLQENEGLDRTSLLLPGKQQQLVSAITLVARGPVVLVVISGGPVDISFAQADPDLPSILWAGYPGQAGGQAIAEIIFGDHNPGGKLPITWYPESFTSVPMTNMNMRPDAESGYPGRSYRFYTGNPVFAFGYGLSYTSFTHSITSVPCVVGTPSLHEQSCYLKHSLSTRDFGMCSEDDSNVCKQLNFRVEVLIKNEGSRAGSDVVMLYSVPPGSGTDGTALRTLIGYQRVHLESLAHRQLVFQVEPCKDLSTVKPNGKRSLDAGEHILTLGTGITHSVLFVNADLVSRVQNVFTDQ